MTVAEALKPDLEPWVEAIATRIAQKMLAKPPGETLRQLRERLKPDVAPVIIAVSSGIALSYLQKLERGEYMPGHETCAAISRALGCTIVEVEAAAAASVAERKQRKLRIKN